MPTVSVYDDDPARPTVDKVRDVIAAHWCAFARPAKCVLTSPIDAWEFAKHHRHGGRPDPPVVVRGRSYIARYTYVAFDYDPEPELDDDQGDTK